MRITAVTPYDDPPAADRTVTLDDDEVLLPGVVDTHVHVNEPGRTEWEGFASATARRGRRRRHHDPRHAAQLGAADHDVSPALEDKRAPPRARSASTSASGAARCPGNVADLAPLHDAGVFGFKCFLLDSGVEEFGHLEPEPFAAAWRRPPASAR